MRIALYEVNVFVHAVVQVGGGLGVHFRTQPCVDRKEKDLLCCLSGPRPTFLSLPSISYKT